MTADQKQIIQNTIAKGETATAIQKYLDIYPNDMVVLQLSGRFNGLKRSEMLGTLSYSEANAERSKIVSALLDMIGAPQQPAVPVQMVNQENDGIVTRLNKIIALKRQHPDYASAATNLLKQYQGYLIEKTANVTYDIRGRMLNAITSGLVGLETQLTEASDNNAISFVDKVNALIEADVPEYDKLTEAYGLCVGRGMSDGLIEKTLQLKLNDDTTKAWIATKIESFISTL